MTNLKACDIGDYIFPNSISLFNVPFNPDVERFNNSNPITIRWWNEDPNCGILDSKLIKTNNRCIVGNQYGRIVEYSHVDINCDRPIENTPIDTFAPILLLAVSVLVLIKRNKLKIV